MVDEKWYLSKTVWGVLVGFAALILANFGYTITSEQGTDLTNTLVMLAQAISGLVGFILVLIGKVQSNRKIRSLTREVRRLGGHPHIDGDDLH